MAAYYADGADRHSGYLRENSEDFFIRLAIDWRGRDTKFPGVAERTREFRLARARLDLKCESGFHRRPFCAIGLARAGR